MINDEYRSTRRARRGRFASMYAPLQPHTPDGFEIASWYFRREAGSAIRHAAVERCGLADHPFDSEFGSDPRAALLAHERTARRVRDQRLQRRSQSADVAWRHDEAGLAVAIDPRHPRR